MKAIGWANRLAVWALPVTLGGCIMPSEKKQISDDIFSLQTRVVQLESGVEAKHKDITTNEEVANKRIASSNVKVEQLYQDIQRLKGEIDTLRVGVKTGRMPGEPGYDGSIADTLEQLKQKITEMEANQQTLQETIDNLKTAPKKSSSNDKADAVDLEGFRTSFKKERYTFIIEHAEDLLAETSGKKQKQEIMYFYAESLFKKGKMRDAALKYNELIELSPSKARLTHAKMRLGDCFRNLGDKATAKLYYEELVSQDPNGPEGKKAKEQLKKL